MTKGRSLASLGMTRWFHPRRRTLVAFALGDLEDRAKVARHLEDCSECRRFVGFTQRLGNASASLPARAPADELLARALADRAAGARVILPANPSTRQPANPRWVQVAGIAAVAAVIALISFQRGRAIEFRGTNQLLLAGLAPRSAEAGQGGTASGALTHRIRPMKAVFARRIIDSVSGRATDWGFLEISVDSGAMPGTWLATGEWRGLEHVTDMQGARVWAETVTVADQSFAPIRRIAHVTPYRRWAGIRIDQSFRGDSVVGQMSLDQDPTRRPIAHDLRSVRDRLIPSDVLSPFWLIGVPLVEGTVIDTGILGWAVVPNDVLAPLRMKVVGSERVKTPAGTFDCWLMTVSVANQTHFHWVRKSDHLGVLTRRRLPNGNTREVILYREGADR